MRNLQFILHENVKRDAIMDEPLTTLGFKFEKNGTQYGDYIAINKPSISAEEAVKVVNELCLIFEKMMMAELEGANVEIRKTSAQELKETIPFMVSDDYKDRFIAEYHQTKIRYERLKAFNNKIEAARITAKEEPKHDCPREMLREQQSVMGEYLHILEVRAAIEGIDL